MPAATRLAVTSRSNAIRPRVCMRAAMVEEAAPPVKGIR
jgi:hypothetical protein